MSGQSDLFFLIFYLMPYIQHKKEIHGTETMHGNYSRPITDVRIPYTIVYKTKLMKTGDTGTLNFNLTKQAIHSFSTYGSSECAF